MDSITRAEFTTLHECVQAHNEVLEVLLNIVEDLKNKVDELEALVDHYATKHIGPLEEDVKALQVRSRESSQV